MLNKFQGGFVGQGVGLKGMGGIVWGAGGVGGQGPALTQAGIEVKRAAVCVR